MTSSRINTALRTAALVTGAALALSATGQASARKPAPGAATSANWSSQIAATANGSYRMGNPEAPVKLTEYVSYTCSHCAHFHKEADPALRLTLVPKGQISITVTNLLRNPIDLAVALLVNCGDPKRFFVRHNAFFATQDAWLAKAGKFGEAQQQRWYQGTLPERMRAIAGDFGFYATVAGWGVTRAQADACLANEAVLDKLRAQQQDVAALGIDSTPSFTLNGAVLPVHDWPSVSKAITDKLAEQRADAI